MAFPKKVTHEKRKQTKISYHGKVDVTFNLKPLFNITNVGFPMASLLK